MNKFRTIHKFRVQSGPFIVRVPSKDFKVLLVAMQRDEPHVWIEVEDKLRANPDFRPVRDSISIAFSVVETGGDVPLNAIHVGSWLMHSDSLVWHLYQLP